MNVRLSLFVWKTFYRQDQTGKGKVHNRITNPALDAAECSENVEW